MGKSIRCKVKKRLRTAKRQRVDAMIIAPRERAHSEALKRVAEGRQVTLARPKNGFLYPKEPDAIFPQHEIMKPIDFRSENLPMARFAFRGNRRKYAGVEAQDMKELSKTHPKMQVLAGGGAVMATTGQKVSKEEAELFATAHRNPAAAAMYAAPASASSAVAEALAAEEAADEVADDDKEMEEADPENAADHSRRPLVKDTRRVKRTAEARPRSANVGKKNKPANPAAVSEKPAPVKKTAGKTKAGGDKMQD
mmetsp:Transcript_2484/g.9634  ORF Transcript_2484/g.9634 Transcript_2484/m.9634 type:complete len:253 (+) Transcript_2484:173-931(+)